MKNRNDEQQPGYYGKALLRAEEIERAAARAAACNHTGGFIRRADSKTYYCEDCRLVLSIVAKGTN